MFYTQAGTGSGPGAAIAEVVVHETFSVVAITLFERELAGTYPDGAVAARALAAVPACIEVELEQPLGQRRVIDGSTGETARILDRGAREPSQDWIYLKVFERGCPLWTR